jgi:thioredoxin 1|tara:strand:+ start:31 stop:576 length:546 start_codon:yes stop_codon:yes gene_type:complete
LHRDKFRLAYLGEVLVKSTFRNDMWRTRVIAICFPKGYQEGVKARSITQRPIPLYLVQFVFFYDLERSRGFTYMSDTIVHVSDDSFEQDVLSSDKPVLVDYWAEWCGPCKSIAPVLEEIADEYQEKMTVAKINVDDNPSTPPKYGIRGIPTLMLFKNGAVEATKVGAVSKAQLSAFIDENL